MADLSTETETLGTALPKEMARVRDQVMPAYIAIGPPGALALHMMRVAQDNAARAMMSGDVLAMLAAYEELKGFEA